MIKNNFQKIISRRKKALKHKEILIDDLQEIEESMLACYQETITFLATATREEIAIALEGITAFARKYPKQQIVDVCKEKIVQFRNLQKYCRINIIDTIKAIEECVNVHTQQQGAFKVELAKQIDKRKQTLQFDANADFDWVEEEALVNLILRDFEETKKQLKGATAEETAFAILALDNLLGRLSSNQVKELIDIFKQKRIEFENIQEYCEYDYIQQIEEAESYLEKL